MITPAQVKNKAASVWQRQSLLRAWLNDEPLFPYPIACNPPGGKVISERFADVRDWILSLQQQAGDYYRIDYKTINHRQLGTQKIPRHIVFASQRDLLRFIGKTKEFETFVELTENTLRRWPVLKPWLAKKPLLALEHAGQWQALLNVCDYFSRYPRPGLYLRQLSIPDIDSKFIENHRAILTELLDRILPLSAIDSTVSGLTQHGFERRFGLRYDQALMRFRIPDPAQTIGGLGDLSVPLSDFRKLALPQPRVFITENKINGLAFPPLADAIVIFGLGYGIQSLATVPWLRDRQIIYWGDIDTHGFAILSQLRGYFPQTESFLMDVSTLLNFRRFCVQEPEAKRFNGQLKHLDKAEEELFRILLANRLGRNLRLEQERIPFDYVVQKLAAKSGKNLSPVRTLSITRQV